MLVYEKSVGICICYRPTIGGFSHCLIVVGRQRRSPRQYMQSVYLALFLTEYCRMQDNYITTGIYRCSTLDYDLKFCENFQWPRISADKRFLCIYSGATPAPSTHPAPLYPRPGLLRCSLRPSDNCRNKQ